MKQAIPFVLAFAVLSCSDKEVKDENEPVVELQEVSSINNSSVGEMELDTFSTIPDEFIGCGCTLYQSEQDKKTGSYIYRDAGDIAMIILNGDVQKLNYKGENDEFTFYANDSVEIKMEITETIESAEMEETSDVKGVFTISKGKNKLEQKFVGYCGC